MTWYRFVAGGALELAVHAQPGARRASVELYGADAVKIKVTAKAVDGAANAAIIECIASRLDVARSTVCIVAGAAGRRKRVRIDARVTDPQRLLDAPAARNRT
ncbi:MAG: DUF167 domain-containing protein [Burkholderiales bacterium]|nr:DUF167 domain-containing protein [Burkholderiales bacterium]